ncbi:MAG: glutaredoxin family protein, partial [Chloroflexota bacterium]
AGPALAVRLYERPGCGLCAETYRALSRLRRDIPLAIERVDIEGDSALVDRYTLRIPVVAVGERELDAAGLDEAAIRRFLEQTPAR